MLQLNRFLQTKPKRTILTLTLPSLQHLSYSFPNKTKRIPLTPKTVHSTLLNCPSDLISLSFFLWCAKQPNYFHDRFAFNHMVSVVNRLIKQFENVKELINELESIGYVVKPQTFLLLLRIFWVGGNNNFVCEVSDEMECYGYVLNVFARNVMMDVCFKSGHVDMALRVLKETTETNYLSFNIAVCNLCKLNDLFNLRSVIRMMLKERYYPNVETFEVVLNCFCKVGSIGEALQVLGLMITLGKGVSVRVWNMLIDGFSRVGKIVLADDLLEKMVESGSSPNVVTYTSLIKRLMESQNVSRALSIYNNMQQSGCQPDLVLYNVLINCYAKIGWHDDAFRVFSYLVKQKLEPDAYTFTSILSSICMAKKFGLMPELADGCKIEADIVVCNSLLNYFNKAGFPSHAIRLYDDMVERGFVDVYTFAGLISALCKAGRIEEAVNAYHGIVMNQSVLDAHIHTLIMHELIKVGKFHKAIRLFKRAVAKNYPLDVVSYTVAISGLCRAGRTKEASLLYRRMKEIGVHPNAYTYNIMLHGFSESRDVEIVSQTLQAMIEAGIQLESDTFIRVADVLLKSHSSQSAFDLLVQMQHLGLLTGKAMHLLMLDGLGPGVVVDDRDWLLLKGGINKNLIADSSGSEDLADMVASVG